MKNEEIGEPVDLSTQFGVPFVDLDAIAIDPEVVSLVPEELARRHQLIVFEKTAGYPALLKVAMTDSTNPYAIDDVKFETGLHVDVHVAVPGAVARALDKYYADPPPDAA